MADKVRLLSIADTPSAQEQGFQYVRNVEDMTGMLFKFQQPRILSFWMRNTYVPLEIAFANADGVVVKTERMIPFSTRSVTSGAPCVMALEVPVGTLEKIGCKPGARMVIDWDAETVEIDG